MKIHGSRTDVEQQRKAVRPELQGLYVLAVVEIGDGEWGWVLCPDRRTRPLES